MASVLKIIAKKNAASAAHKQRDVPSDLINWSIFDQNEWFYSNGYVTVKDPKWTLHKTPTSDAYCTLVYVPDDALSGAQYVWPMFVSGEDTNGKEFRARLEMVCDDWMTTRGLAIGIKVHVWEMDERGCNVAVNGRALHEPEVMYVVRNY